MRAAPVSVTPGSSGGTAPGWLHDGSGALRGLPPYGAAPTSEPGKPPPVSDGVEPPLRSVKSLWSENPVCDGAGAAGADGASGACAGVVSTGADGIEGALPTLPASSMGTSGRRSQSLRRLSVDVGQLFPMKVQNLHGIKKGEGKACKCSWLADEAEDEGQRHHL